ncbi:ribosome recycling factor [Candidatus Roizmanbacteria bacterium CG_4_10_14_0_8_um_filter_39_9]|uniref:Ribosome recycling factor n=1 Tax=Candidatus Roizmanbacteria bacterium CG_4_10_14_0_8_um_filter_39_9 TaxID=1974829 RepID=A0A2M7QE63_9BACT|nr:MAG: ribosome recycling factor [Candidatus Roizmanbacteria bacterium CG_4_10_14_0_8_um_filter_39_9]
MDLTAFKQQLASTVSALKEDLKTIRTGRANPIIVEQLMVDAYGGSAKLKVMELASITTEGSAAVVIIPFDPSTVPDIEKAILKSPLGLTPQTQGTRIIIRIPPLSAEQRDKYVKLVGQKIEEKRNVIRNHRDDIRKKIKASFDEKNLTEDDKFRLEKEIDALAQKVNEELVIVKEAKEKEIQAV